MISEIEAGEGKQPQIAQNYTDLKTGRKRLAGWTLNRPIWKPRECSSVAQPVTRTASHQIRVIGAICG